MLGFSPQKSATSRTHKRMVGNAPWSVGYNKWETKPSEHLPGGTGILVVNEFSHQALCPGNDKLGMGHWSWIRLRGKAGHVLQIIVAYQPCVSSRPMSTHQQQVQYLTQTDQTNLPKKLFLQDILKAIMEWQAEGDSIILAADMNNDIRDPEICTTLRSVGLIEVSMNLHVTQPPATHNQGSAPIDGIFIPLTLLEHCQAGYLAFGDGVPSNHWALWLDIPTQCICPVETEMIARPPAWQLQCKDPQVVTRYNQTLLTLLKEDNLEARACTLASEVKICLTKSQQEHYEAINKAATEYKRHMETKCRKLHAGTVQWLVPTSFTCHQSHLVLERDAKLQARMRYWKLGPANQSQEGRHRTTC